MTDDRLSDASDQAQAERAADVGWEPADWSACLRRERRKQLATVIGLVVFVGVVLPVLGLVVLDRPPSLSYWFWGAFTLIFVAETAYSFASAAGRVQWERETRQAVRVRHALRHHRGIGAADRALVTERARSLATGSKVASVGWPLLALLLVVGILEGRDPRAFLIVLVVACLLLVARAVRRARLARRWLADPLPRDEPTP